MENPRGVRGTGLELREKGHGKVEKTGKKE